MKHLKKINEDETLNEGRNLSVKDVLEYYEAHHASTLEELAQVIADFLNGRTDARNKQDEMSTWLDN
jgi:hypothetical protein